MNQHNRKRKLTGPWRNLHGAVWLIGLAILAWKGWWWPGILILVAISMIIEGLLMRFVPNAFEPDEALMPPPPVLPPSLITNPAPEYRLDLLPATCSKCGGPIRGHDVKWTSAQSADCPYCGAKLSIEKNES